MAHGLMIAEGGCFPREDRRRYDRSDDSPGDRTFLAEALAAFLVETATERVEHRSEKHGDVSTTNHYVFDVTIHGEAHHLIVRIFNVDVTTLRRSRDTGGKDGWYVYRVTADLYHGKRAKRAKPSVQTWDLEGDALESAVATCAPGWVRTVTKLFGKGGAVSGAYSASRKLFRSDTLDEDGSIHTDTFDSATIPEARPGEELLIVSYSDVESYQRARIVCKAQVRCWDAEHEAARVRTLPSATFPATLYSPEIKTPQTEWLASLAEHLGTKALKSQIQLGKWTNRQTESFSLSAECKFQCWSSAIGKRGRAVFELVNAGLLSGATEPVWKLTRARLYIDDADEATFDLSGAALKAEVASFTPELARRLQTAGFSGSVVVQLVDGEARGPHIMRRAPGRLRPTFEILRFSNPAEMIHTAHVGKAQLEAWTAAAALDPLLRAERKSIRRTGALGVPATAD